MSKCKKKKMAETSKMSKPQVEMSLNVKYVEIFIANVKYVTQKS